jgi:AcrR family transcriptional regulator
LIRGALTAFGARGYAAVSVAELAESADVTIGSLYHHFGSKIGIYSAVRTDVERRVLDRMEGAAAVRQPAQPADVGAVLLVGFDYLVGAGFARLLAEAHPERESDPIETFLATLADRGRMPIGRILLAAWRAALEAVADGVPAGLDPRHVRAALREVIRV